MRYGFLHYLEGVLSYILEESNERIARVIERILERYIADLIGELDELKKRIAEKKRAGVDGVKLIEVLVTLGTIGSKSIDDELVKNEMKYYRTMLEIFVLSNNNMLNNKISVLFIYVLKNNPDVTTLVR